MRKITLVRIPFLIPTWATAQVLWPRTIFVNAQKPAPSVSEIAHELAHIDQITLMGLVRYWFVYLRLLMRYGYDKHPMEIEAREYGGTGVALRRAALLLGEAQP